MLGIHRMTLYFEMALKGQQWITKVRWAEADSEAYGEDMLRTESCGV